LEDAGDIRRVEGLTISRVDFGDGKGIEDVFTAMDSSGDAVFIDKAYQMRKHENAAAADEDFNSHELNIVNNGTRAMIVSSQYRHDDSGEELQRAGLPERCPITCNGFAE